MAGYTVLRDAGETLKKLVMKNIQELSDENSVLFVSPAEMEAATTPKLSIFLYQTSENAHFRNAGMEASGPLALKQKMQYPPLAVDLSYLFTPYAQNRETELIIMERLMQTFYDNAALRGDILQGCLQQAGNSELRLVPNALSLEDLNKLWGIFPNKAFKLSASYLLTPVRIPSSRETLATRVVEKDLDVYKVAG